MADPFHQAAVTHAHVGVVIHQRVPETGIHDPLGERHAHRVRQPLSERARGGLDPVGVAIFRMPGGLAVDLAEPLDLLDRHVLVAGQVKQRIQQHRPVAVGNQEPVAVQPMRVFHVKAQKL